ncbi:uncharacterized protein C16orf86 homolog isoform X2 [Notamacropus eugenii]|uniref:uncharacterized protein C16orf86 homolog isoform X2 n=1 Tax=Notamacropus eugenii TaxID=9315 RepID=UPI003B674C90
MWPSRSSRAALGLTPNLTEQKDLFCKTWTQSKDRTGGPGSRFPTPGRRNILVGFFPVPITSSITRITVAQDYLRSESPVLTLPPSLERRGEDESRDSEGRGPPSPFPAVMAMAGPGRPQGQQAGSASPGGPGAEGEERQAGPGLEPELEPEPEPQPEPEPEPEPQPEPEPEPQPEPEPEPQPEPEPEPQPELEPEPEPQPELEPEPEPQPEPEPEPQPEPEPEPQPEPEPEPQPEPEPEPQPEPEPEPQPEPEPGESLAKDEEQLEPRGPRPPPPALPLRASHGLKRKPAKVEAQLQVQHTDLRRPPLRKEESDGAQGEPSPPAKQHKKAKKRKSLGVVPALTTATVVPTPAEALGLERKAQRLRPLYQYINYSNPELNQAGEGEAEVEVELGLVPNKPSRGPEEAAAERPQAWPLGGNNPDNDCDPKDRIPFCPELGLA